MQMGRASMQIVESLMGTWVFSRSSKSKHPTIIDGGLRTGWPAVAENARKVQ
jgi:hypothetical protein